MNTFFISSAVALALTATPLAAGPTHIPGDVPLLGTTAAEQLWLAKDNQGKGKGQGNGKAMGKGQGNPGTGKHGHDRAQGRNGPPGAERGSDHPAGRGGKSEHAGGPKVKANNKAVERGSQGNGNGRQGFTTADREEAFSRIVSTPAPDGRDMKRLLARPPRA